LRRSSLARFAGANEEIYSMLEFAYGLLTRCVVIVPLLMIVTAATWATLRKFGLMRLSEPFNAGDMRTWTLGYAMGDAAIFGFAFLAIASILGEGQLAAAFIAIGAAPLFLARLQK
jgi:hypothetical protein